MLKLFISMAALFLGVGSSVFAQIEGKVYIDANGNGICDAGERGLKGVCVQDGLNVVKTTDDGHFILPGHKDTRFVTLTVPDGYQASTSHYLSFDGTGKKYELGICKTSVNTGNGYSFVQITDTETSLYGDWIDNLKEYVKTNPTAFIIHTGDICYEAHQDFHGRYLRSVDLGVPTYYCVGNHDLRAGKYGEELWQSHFGPSWYSFNVGNVHYVVTPMLGGDHAPSYRRSDIIRWLKNDLAQTDKGKRIVLFNHDLWFWGDDLLFKDKNGEQIDFADYNLDAMIYGHWHNHYYKQLKSGLHTYCSSTPDKGGIDHGTSCFRIYNADTKGKLSSATRYTYIDGILTSAYPAEGETVSVPDGKMTVRINAYRTISDAKKVTASVERNGRLVSTVTLMPETDWGWSGAVRVSGGKQRLLVTAEFEDGTRLTKRVDYTVTKQPLSVIATSDVWAGLRGNAAHNQLVNDSVSLPLQTNWIQNVGSNIYMCSPIVAQNKVFIGTIDDDKAKKCYVKAYDATTGHLCWTFVTSNSIKNTIAYEDGRIFASDASGMLYAIDAEKGTACWQTQLPVSLLPLLDEGLAVADGVVYAGHAKGTCAVQAVDGKILWQNKAWDGGEGTTSTFTVGAGVLVASAYWNGLFGHDISNGALLWKKRDSKIRFRDGSATFYDGNFYLASCENLYVINPRSGDILKMAETSYEFNSACAPLVTDKYLIVSTSNKGVVAFDRLTFKEVWNYRTGTSLFYTVPYSHNQECTVEVSPVLVGSAVLFGASDGYLHAVDLNTGAYRGKRALGAPVFSSVAVSGNCLFVADFGGNIYNFKLHN